MNLQDIYDSLPTIDCQGFCHIFCGPIIIYPAERENWWSDVSKHKDMNDACIRFGNHIRKKHKVDTDGCLTCPMLKDKRCSIHPKRPIICRLWGMVESLKCPFGCKPTRYLSDKECETYIDAVENLTPGNMSHRL